MKFGEFVTILNNLEESTSRNEMMEALAGFLEELDKEEVRSVMYMLTGRIAPKFIPLEFNFSSKLLLKALKETLPAKVFEVDKLMNEKGDVGLVAEEVRKEQGDAGDVEILEVYDELVKIAKYEGTGSQQMKAEAYTSLFSKLDSLGNRYLARMIVGKLRLGLSDKTILDALSWVAKGDKSYRDQLDYAYGVRADIGEIAELVLGGDFSELESLKIEPGVPVASKLVEREKSVEAVFERIPKALVQPKYDGLRMQIHYSRGGFESINMIAGTQDLEFSQGMKMFDLVSNESAKVQTVRIFSRNMEPLTDMFPDVVEEIKKLNEGSQNFVIPSSFVLDAEAIGIDPKTGEYIPFQETIKRKRKYGIKEKSEGMPVKVHIFDVLYLDRDISQEKLVDRLETLSDLSNKYFRNSEIFEMSESVKVKSSEEVEELFLRYLDVGLEGAIVKDLESRYLPGTRNYDWIKLKANIDTSMIDTVDCVVLGYYYGRGVRAKYGIGALLVGVMNKEKDRFESIAKVGSGIKDDEWEQIVKDLKEIETGEVPDEVVIKKELVPDVLVEPKIVVVVDADEITKSKLHTAGAGKDGVGYSLRFPRLREWNRLDKSAEDVTSVGEIVKLLTSNS